MRRCLSDEIRIQIRRALHSLRCRGNERTCFDFLHYGRYRFVKVSAVRRPVINRGFFFRWPGRRFFFARYAARESRDFPQG